MQDLIEKQRKDNEAAAARSEDLLEARLKLIEQSIATHRLDELERLDTSNRAILIAAGAFAVAGFLVLLFAAFVQWSAVGRLTAIAARFPAALGQGSTTMLGIGDDGLGPNQLEQSTSRFLNVIEKLEKRMDSIERAAPHVERLADKPAAEPSLKNGGSTSHEHANGASLSVVEAPSALPSSESALAHDSSENGQEKAAHNPEAQAVALLMGKGQTLVKLDKPEDAIQCFDEALAIDADNAEVLMRKGGALEHLERFNEAIACYDLAIAADRSLTMAYMYKGGVYNRMERYTEALECYEEALKTHQKAAPAASVAIEG